MKTAIQQLIEELNGDAFKELFIGHSYIKEYLEFRLKSIYLDSEKEQIIEAYRSGKHDSGIDKKYSSEDYYQQTFNSEQ